MNKDITVGLDLGDRFSHFCVLDGEGAVLKEDRVRTTPEALQERFGAMKPVVLAMEVGTHSPWVSRVLSELGHDVVVANPAKLRMIYQNPSKCDRADAMMLARVARLDRALLSPIHHRSRGTQQDLQLLQTRNALVKTRTQWINHMRGLAKALGYRLPSCSAPSFHKRVAKDLPELRRWGLARCAQGGKTGKKRAVAAVARKLAVLLHRLWSTGEIYDPFYTLHAKTTTP